MKHIRTEETKMCDCCGAVMEGIQEYPNPEYALVMNITLFTLAGKFSIRDVCDTCNKKIMQFLIENKLLQFIQPN